MADLTAQTAVEPGQDPGVSRGSEPLAFRWAIRGVALLLAGYLFFDKAFAYLHIPGTPLFIGEIVIAVVVVYLIWWRPRTGIASSAAGFFLMLFLLFSVARTLPYLSEFGVDAVRDAAIWYYAAFAFFAVAFVDQRGLDPAVDWYGRMQVPFVVWAPFAILLYATVSRPFVPDTNVSIFDHSVANISVMLFGAVLYFWFIDRPTGSRLIVRRALITGGSALVIALGGIYNRGGLVAVMAGVAVAVLLGRGPQQRRFLSIMGATLLTVFAVAWLLDFKVDVFDNQREVSVRQFVDNLVSLTGQGSGVVQEDLEGTASWRLNFWEQIIEDVSSNHFLGGLGYGLDIADRYGFVGAAEGFRTAHNSHMTIFGRSGFVGVLLWGLMWWAWYHGLLRTRRRMLARQAERVADVCAWLVAMATVMNVNAVFDPTYESPMVAAWMWTIFGVGIAVTLAARPGHRPTSRYGAPLRSAITEGERTSG